MSLSLSGTVLIEDKFRQSPGIAFTCHDNVGDLDAYRVETNFGGYRRIACMDNQIIEEIMIAACDSMWADVKPAGFHQLCRRPAHRTGSYNRADGDNFR